MSKENPLWYICSNCDKLFCTFKKDRVCECGCDFILPIDKETYEQALEDVKKSKATSLPP